MDNLVTVGVPVFNTRQYLSRCIKSILRQTHKELQIIFVDDGSTDGSAGLLDFWESKDKRITVIHNQNHGVSFSRNVVLDHAKGKYILFVDSDDYIQQNYCGVLLETIKKTNADIVFSSYQKTQEKTLKQTLDFGNAVYHLEYQKQNKNINAPLDAPFDANDAKRMVKQSDKESVKDAKIIVGGGV